MAIGFLLTDENKGETPSIPEIILKINHEVSEPSERALMKTRAFDLAK